MDGETHDSYNRMQSSRNRWLKEHFIHGLKDDSMLLELICKLTAITDTSAVTSDQVLLWARWVEAKRTQTAVVNNLKVNKEFNVI